MRKPNAISGRTKLLVTSDSETLEGTPVFRGKRAPIHFVAELLSHGETAETLRNGYPRRTDEMIRPGSVFAGAHPLRGRWYGFRFRSKESAERRGNHSAVHLAVHIVMILPYQSCVRI